MTLDESISSCLRRQLPIFTMFLARRSVAPARQALRRQQPRRFDSHAAHHDHHHAGPVNEAFGVCHPSFDVSQTNWETSVPVPCGSTSVLTFAPFLAWFLHLYRHSRLGVPPLPSQQGQAGIRLGVLDHRPHSEMDSPRGALGEKKCHSLSSYGQGR